MSDEPFLLPPPRTLSIHGRVLNLKDRLLIVLDGDDVPSLHFAGLRLAAAVRQHARLTWEMVAGPSAPPSVVGARLSLVPGAAGHPQGYQLRVDEHGLSVVAAGPAGIFYAVCTIAQLLAQYGRALPLLLIVDWPDFAQRGVLLDISRDKVPQMDTLYALVDLLASWKVNQLQLYTEHTFAYRRHPAVWADASPITGEEVLALDAYCRQRHIELVPNQNSFGHMRRWLVHEAYRPLAECPDGCDTEWGRFDEPFSLCPLDPGSLDLVRGLFDELLPHFQSRLLNAGCDETVDLGQGRSAAAVRESGAGRVYLDFLLAIYRLVKARGRTMMFWGDIIVKYPELVDELPPDAIALEWGYEADHPFDEHGALFAASGVPFYVCPGTSSWNSLAGRTDNAVANLRSAALHGLRHGAAGYLVTDWGDNGHWQPLAASYLPFGYGAALAWNAAAGDGPAIVPAVSRFAMGDASEELGRLAAELGTAHQRGGLALHNTALPFALLQIGPAELDRIRQAAISGSLGRAALAETADHIAGIAQQLAASTGSDPLIREELLWAAKMLEHGCRRGIWMLEREQGQEDPALSRQLGRDADRLIAGYERLWQARYRPGGFADSVARMHTMRAAYSASSAS